MHRITSAAILGLVLLPMTADAHGTGLVFEAVIGEYVMDIDFDVDWAVAGEEIFMEFGLVTPPNTPDWEFASYTDVQVTLTRNGKTIFDKALPTSDFKGRRFLNYTFAKAGAYTMTVAFADRGRVLAESSFPVTVEPDPNASDVTWIAVISGLVLLTGAGLYVRKRRMSLP